MQNKPEKSPFEKFHAQQRINLAPQRPKTGRYVETQGAGFNASSTQIVRVAAKAAK